MSESPSLNPPTPADDVAGGPESFRPVTTGDAPTSEDALGYRSYARALSEFLLNPETQGPLTVSIEGEWGSGKSSFLLMVEKHLREGAAAKSKSGRRYNAPVIARFNPWRHDNDEALWASFAMGLTKEVVKGQKLRRRIGGYLRLLLSRFDWSHGWVELLRSALVLLIATGLLLSLLALTAQNGPGWLLRFAQTVNVSKTEAGTTAAKESRPGAEWFRWLSGFGFFGAVAAYLIAVLLVGSKLKTLFSAPLSSSLKKHIRTPDYSSRVSFIEEFHRDFQRVIEAYAQGQTIFVFIDDLDRCSVPKAAELMQAINLMISTDLKSIVFILAMDRAKIAAGLAAKQEEILPYLYPDAPQAAGGKLSPEIGLQFGFEYIEKFIQLAVPLPRPRTSDVDAFLRSLAGATVEKSGEEIPAEGTGPAATASADFQVEFSTDSDNVRKVARELSRFFEDNPRRLKQFINVYRLRAFIAYETGVLRPGRMTPQQLGKLVALQMRWPVWTAAAFRSAEGIRMLKEEPARVRADREVIELLTLARYDGSPWDLGSADLEAFIRVSPVVRAVEFGRLAQVKPEDQVADAPPRDFRRVAPQAHANAPSPEAASPENSDLPEEEAYREEPEEADFPSKAANVAPVRRTSKQRRLKK